VENLDKTLAVLRVRNVQIAYLIQFFENDWRKMYQVIAFSD